MVRRLATFALPLLVAGVLTSCDAEQVYSYRIDTRGPVTADVAEFARHAADTLSDPRGWSLGGAIAFRRTDGPADFTLVLATAASLPSFGPPCHPMWSCRSGDRVVINETRWTQATPTWPFSLDDYRHYVVNHEVGHWLGLGHRSCPGGAGTPAPVMVQQSKGGAAMGACAFNTWPTASELGAVGAARGIRPRPVESRDPFGHLDSVATVRDPEGRPTEVRVRGWAADRDAVGATGIVVLADDRPVGWAVADGLRPDVGAAYPALGAGHGFDVAVAVPTDSGVVCVSAIGEGPGLPFVRLGCTVVK